MKIRDFAAFLVFFIIFTNIVFARQSEPDAVINLGDSFKGRIAFSSDEDLLVFNALEGTQLGVSVAGTAPLFAELQILDLTTEASLDFTGFVKGVGTKTVTISKFVLPTTGPYAIVISSFDGSTGPYTLKTTAKLPKTATSIKVEAPVDPQTPTVVLFDAFAGATLNGSLAPSTGSLAILEILGLGTPSGGTEDISPFVTIKGTKLTLKNVPVGEFGQSALGFVNTGALGNVKATLTIKQPKFTKTTHVEEAESLTPGAVSGTLAIQTVDAFPEIEPNDSTQNDQFVGALSPGNVLRVAGSTTVASGGDVDLYRYIISESQTITITLLHDVANDFDFYIVDSQTGDLIPGLGFATSNKPEIGIIDITFQGQGQAEFDIAVVPFAGAGTYQLTVVSVPFNPAIQAAGAPPGGGLAMRRSIKNDIINNKPQHASWSDALVDRVMELDRPFVSGEFVVQLRDTKTSPESWAAREGLSVRAASPGGAFVVTIPGVPRGIEADRNSRLATMRRKQQIRKLPDVDFAEPNYIYRTAGLPQGGNTPNDPFFGNQWHLPAINIPQAWNITKGSANVIIAILDTGTTAHPDLVSRDSGTGFDMISDPQISNDGGGIDNNPTDPGDLSNQGKSSWHGTHVAGTIGAATNNGVGVAGVDWFCKLMHIRVLGVGGGTNFDIGEGMKYAARIANASGQLPAVRANAINMSLGGPGSSQNQQNIVNQVRAAGVAVIAAAGNENTSTPSFPASYTGVISVAATEFANNRAPYSNFGPNIDVAAPGGDTGADLNNDNFADGVLSTLVNDSVNPFTFIFKFYQGTSMACPHVAGVAALLYSVDPALTPDQIEQILESTATDLGTAGFDNTFGNGLVNAFAAVQAAAPQNPGAPAQLGISATALDFGSQTTNLNVSIANIGGGTLNFTASDTEDSGGNWLSVSPANGAAPQTLTITVTRGVLQPGFYTGNVSVTTNGGNANISISMEVAQGAAVPIVLGSILVLAIDVVTFDTGGQATMAQNGTYTIPSLPPGEYIIVAGPDLDNDGFIGGVGEPFGIFPTFETPLSIFVPPGIEITGVDFSIVDDFVLPSIAPPPGANISIPKTGFKLLHSPW
ncbi:MAG: S8 family serine peptidase [Planctomycetota bacterium]